MLLKTINTYLSTIWQFLTKQYKILKILGLRFSRLQNFEHEIRTKIEQKISTHLKFKCF